MYRKELSDQRWTWHPYRRFRFNWLATIVWLHLINAITSAQVRSPHTNALSGAGAGSASGGLNIVMFDVPSHSKFGDSVELSCVYDLRNDRLYSIKVSRPILCFFQFRIVFNSFVCFLFSFRIAQWYKNDVEFYRYVPKDWPPGQFLPMPGIRVDVSRCKC